MFAFWIWMTIGMIYLFKDVIMTKVFLYLLSWGFLLTPLISAILNPNHWALGMVDFFISWLCITTLVWSFIFMEFVLKTISEISVLILTLLSWYMYFTLYNWEYSSIILILLTILTLFTVQICLTKKEIDYTSKVILYTYNISFALMLLIIQFPEIQNILEWKVNYSFVEMIIFWIVSISLINYSFYLLFFLPGKREKNYFHRIKVYSNTLASKFSNYQVSATNAFAITIIFLFAAYMNNSFGIISDISFVNFVFALSFLFTRRFKQLKL